MLRISATVRISLSLASITLCALLLSMVTGFIPDRLGAIADGRKSLCETLTVGCSLAARTEDRESIELLLNVVKARNPEVASIALRRTDGRMHTVVGDHDAHWTEEPQRSTHAHMMVPIQVAGASWGQLEMAFLPAGEQNWTFLPTSALRHLLFVLIVSLLGHYLFLRKVLRHLDPSKVIPDRVRQTLDSLAEGLLVVDRDERIVLANESFAQTIGKRPNELQGHQVSTLPWQLDDSQESPEHPWKRSICNGTVETGQVLTLGDDAAVQRVFQVNTAPIPGENGENRGAIASFNDVTALEVRNSQLGETLTELQESRDKIAEQNEKLRKLAMVDPLTQCLNRRAFFEEMEHHVAAAERQDTPISYIIMDIDLFKSVNDNHGHSTGDAVLQETAEILLSTINNRGFVCRYGGEEFSVLLPQTTADEAVFLAEQARCRIELSSIANLRITASFGVVEIVTGQDVPLSALDHADKALYTAKQKGRNRVVLWDPESCDVELDRGEGDVDPSVETQAGA